MTLTLVHDQSTDTAGSTAAQIVRARTAQRSWAAQPLRKRVAVVRDFRQRLAVRAKEVASVVKPVGRRSTSETLTSEVLPLLESCRYLERESARILRPHVPHARRPPVWLRNVDVRLVREPLGVVLVLGPANYPLFLPAVQSLQAVTAGNSLLLKPGVGGSESAAMLAGLLRDAGLPEGVLQVLEESVECGSAAIAAGVDKILLTGSATTGAAVSKQAAPSLTPVTMELSGCDAVFVLDDASSKDLARALRFGLELNGGATCISPRRVFATERMLPQLERDLMEELFDADSHQLAEGVGARVRELVINASRSGARILWGETPVTDTMRPLVLTDANPGVEICCADLFAPVLSLIPVKDMEEAVDKAQQCPYALGAAVFGASKQAQALAERIPAGVVTINDLIAPTADPRVPFGGHGLSGYGRTRGDQGLLELTRTKAVVLRRGRFKPHFDKQGSGLESLALNYIRARDAKSIWMRARSTLRTLGALIRLSKQKRR